MLNSYRAVLFDLDGTLVDHSNAARAGVIAWSLEPGAGNSPRPGTVAGLGTTVVFGL